MLETVDLTQTLPKEGYEEQLPRWQTALHELAYQVYLQKRPVVIVFEGWDAAGKGGTIKRLTERLDPRGYVVYPIGKPAGDDATRHYLYRFWRRLPSAGQIAIFDRSWYGRVLVERVEAFATEAEWRRAYREINQYERQLADFGGLIFKFWLHISPEEQMKRFKDREVDELRQWKLTEEDWRNRDKWPDYTEAVNEMLLKTSTVTAPWTVVAGNCKRHARVTVLRTLTEGLTEALNHRPSVL